MIGLGRVAAGRRAINLLSGNRSRGLHPEQPTWLREQLANLVRATGSNGGLIGRHDYGSGVSQLIASVGMPADCEYLARGAFDPPWLKLRRYFQASGLVWRGSDIIAPDQLDQTPFYRQVMAPQGAGSTLHATITVRGPRLDHVLLVRPQGAPDYSDDAIEMCRNYVAGGELVEAGLLSIFEDRGLGVAIVDTAANVLAANRMFAEIAGSLGSGRAALSRRPADPESPVTLPDAIADWLADGDYPSTRVLQAKRGELRFTCDLRPVASERAGPMSRAPLIAIVMSDLDATPYLDEAALQSAFGLSPAEARVSALVGRGERLEDAASLLGISPNTARTHLKRIFEKTATHRQAELVKVLLTLVRRNP